MDAQIEMPALPGPGLVPGPVFVSFELPGQPRGKGRHRSRIVFPKEHRASIDDVMKHAFMHQYPDPETATYEEALAWVGKAAMRGRAPSDKPMACLIHAFKLVPVSWSRKDRERALTGIILPTGKPDGDNYDKIVGDALNGIVWVDDAAIIDWRVIKLYSEKPAMRVEAREYIPP